ncbi:hypothetical protein BGX26_012434 [Mortierella sp. AD094]|nr:hypothetical protein BGX26_012434 [Mortierella sp. AD094]
MSIPSQIPETDSEELEKERLDLQLKGRGHISIGYPSDLGTNRWATTTAGGRQHSLGMEGISDDRGDRIPGRHSISKPRTSTSPAVTSSPVVISGSSEMLPLSEFLSQSADDDKVDNQSTEGLGSRTDDTPELNYPMYSSFSTPSAPGLPGRVPITSASGEFSGFQQFPSLHKDRFCRESKQRLFFKGCYGKGASLGIGHALFADYGPCGWFVGRISLLASDQKSHYA